MLAILGVVLSQRDALIAIYNTNGGDQWAGALGWNTSDSICTWKGIDCNPGGIVMTINLSGFGLIGSLADVFDSFTHLKVLQLDDNFLVSAFPATFCKLSNLQYFEASNSGFMGEIPECLCQIQFLMYFKSTYNALTGTIPQCLPQIAYLHAFDASCNSLSGNVPPGTENMQYLKEFNVECNADFICESSLSNSTDIAYHCGMEDCDDCTVPVVTCPANITVEDCGAYIRVPPI